MNAFRIACVLGLTLLSVATALGALGDTSAEGERTEGEERPSVRQVLERVDLGLTEHEAASYSCATRLDLRLLPSDFRLILLALPT